MTTMTLTEFLLARITEDEGVARSLDCALRDKGRAPAHHDMTVSRHRKEWPSFWRAFDRYPDPARVLAECEAKRRIVEDAEQEKRGAEHSDHEFGDHSGHTYDVANSMQDVLKVLATIYADHPDYDAAWRP